MVTANIPRFWSMLLLGGALSHPILSRGSPQGPWEGADSLSALGVRKEAEAFPKSHSKSGRGWVFGQRVDGAARKAPTGIPKPHMAPASGFLPEPLQKVGHPFFMSVC